jgi:hypothetical protein
MAFVVCLPKDERMRVPARVARIPETDAPLFDCLYEKAILTSGG